MAYLIVTDPCLDDAHEDCPGREGPEPEELFCGGGICVCFCHGGYETDHPLYQEVLGYSVKRRERRAEETACS